MCTFQLQNVGLEKKSTIHNIIEQTHYGPRPPFHPRPNHRLPSRPATPFPTVPWFRTTDSASHERNTCRTWANFPPFLFFHHGFSFSCCQQEGTKTKKERRRINQDKKNRGRKTKTTKRSAVKKTTTHHENMRTMPTFPVPHKQPPPRRTART